MEKVSFEITFTFSIDFDTVNVQLLFKTYNKLENYTITAAQSIIYSVVDER